MAQAYGRPDGEARAEPRRTALVTGGGGGIGRAIALRLARDGCDVAVLDRDEGRARATAALVTAAGCRSAHAAADVSVRVELEAAFAALADALGPVDILVNNAGILRTNRVVDVSDEEWRQTFAVNLDGAFYGCRAVLPGMLERRRGTIVSVASWTGKKGVPNHAAYSASKFALVGLTQSLAGEVAEHGIRVNAVCPGIIVETGMRDEAEAMNRAQGLPDVETRAKTIPMRRVGYPEDVADVVAFLCSRDARYMTGQAVNVTGGLWMS